MDEFPHITLEHELLKRHVSFSFNPERCRKAGLEEVPNANNYELIKLRRVYHFNTNTPDHVVFTIPEPVMLLVDKGTNFNLGTNHNHHSTREVNNSTQIFGNSMCRHRNVKNRKRKIVNHRFDDSGGEIIIEKCVPEVRPSITRKIRAEPNSDLVNIGENLIQSESSFSENQQDAQLNRNIGDSIRVTFNNQRGGINISTNTCDAAKTGKESINLKQFEILGTNKQSHTELITDDMQEKSNNKEVLPGEKLEYSTVEVQKKLNSRGSSPVTQLRNGSTDDVQEKSNSEEVLTVKKSEGKPIVDAPEKSNPKEALHAENLKDYSVDLQERSPNKVLPVKEAEINSTVDIQEELISEKVLATEELKNDSTVDVQVKAKSEEASDFEKFTDVPNVGVQERLNNEKALLAPVKKRNNGLTVDVQTNKPNCRNVFHVKKSKNLPTVDSHKKLNSTAVLPVKEPKNSSTVDMQGKPNCREVYHVKKPRNLQTVDAQEKSNSKAILPNASAIEIEQEVSKKISCIKEHKNGTTTSVRENTCKKDLHIEHFEDDSAVDVQKISKEPLSILKSKQDSAVDVYKKSNDRKLFSEEVCKDVSTVEVQKTSSDILLIQKPTNDLTAEVQEKCNESLHVEGPWHVSTVPVQNKSDEVLLNSKPENGALVDEHEKSNTEILHVEQPTDSSTIDAEEKSYKEVLHAEKPKDTSTVDAVVRENDSKIILDETDAPNISNEFCLDEGVEDIENSDIEHIIFGIRSETPEPIFDQENFSTEEIVDEELPKFHPENPSLLDPVEVEMRKIHGEYVVQEHSYGKKIIYEDLEENLSSTRNLSVASAFKVEEIIEIEDDCVESTTEKSILDEETCRQSISEEFMDEDETPEMLRLVIDDENSDTEDPVEKTTEISKNLKLIILQDHCYGKTGLGIDESVTQENSSIQEESIGLSESEKIAIQENCIMQNEPMKTNKIQSPTLDSLIQENSDTSLILQKTFGVQQDAEVEMLNVLKEPLLVQKNSKDSNGSVSVEDSVERQTIPEITEIFVENNLEKENEISESPVVEALQIPETSIDVATENLKIHSSIENPVQETVEKEPKILENAIQGTFERKTNFLEKLLRNPWKKPTEIYAEEKLKTYEIPIQDNVEKKPKIVEKLVLNVPEPSIQYTATKACKIVAKPEQDIPQNGKQDTMEKDPEILKNTVEKETQAQTTGVGDDIFEDDVDEIIQPPVVTPEVPDTDDPIEEEMRRLHEGLIVSQENEIQEKHSLAEVRIKEPIVEIPYTGESGNAQEFEIQKRNSPTESLNGEPITKKGRTDSYQEEEKESDDEETTDTPENQIRKENALTEFPTGGTVSEKFYVINYQAEEKTDESENEILKENSSTEVLHEEPDIERPSSVDYQGEEEENAVGEETRDAQENESLKENSLGEVLTEESPSKTPQTVEYSEKVKVFDTQENQVINSTVSETSQTVEYEQEKEEPINLPEQDIQRKNSPIGVLTKKSIAEQPGTTDYEEKAEESPTLHENESRQKNSPVQQLNDEPVSKKPRIDNYYEELVVNFDSFTKKERSKVPDDVSVGATPSIKSVNSTSICGTSISFMGSNKGSNCSGLSARPKEPYKCTECDFQAKREKHLRVHMRCHIHPFWCNMCLEMFPKIEDLHQHVVVCHAVDKKSKVTKSQVIVTREKNLRSSPTGENLFNREDHQAYKCGFCDYSSSYVKRLQHHTRVHAREKLFSCDKCEYKTLNQWLMQRHKNDHSQDSRQFECDECGFITVYRDQLDHHMQLHSRRKVYKCSQCLFSTAHLGYFNAHIGFHVPKAETVFEFGDDDDVKLELQTVYKCGHCGNRFKQQAMQRHNEKVRCPECSYWVQQSGSVLKRHLPVCGSTELKECDWCAFVADDEFALKAHKKCHAKEGFRCSKCNRQCSTLQKLKLHSLRVHSSDAVKLN